MKNTALPHLFAFLFLFSLSGLIGQTTDLVLQPNAVQGKDALIISKNPTMNHGTHIDFAAMAWTNGGIPTSVRALIEFDLSQIPDGSYIHSASLFLYAHDSPANGSHSTQSGPNIGTISQVVEDWDEQSVSWANQPMTTENNQILIPSSTSPDQDYIDINVTFLIREMLDNPEESHGFLMKLIYEDYYRSLVFASSDHADANLHPKLKISYSEDLITDECITIKAPRFQGKDAYIESRLHAKNYGNHYDLPAMAWTNGGVPVDVRALFEFNLSQIPEEAILDYAKMSLFSHNSPANDAHSTRDGSNESLLCRVTSPWNEHEVTWDNQPEYTSQNQVLLQASEAEIQDYLDIDVTNLIQDMLDEPENSHGFLFKLVVEEYYRSMLFASTDHLDPNLHPSLEVCYSIPSPNKEITIGEYDIKLFPNPTNTSFSFHTSDETGKLKSVKIMDHMGRILKDYENLQENNNFDIGFLPEGVYVVKFDYGEYGLCKKLIVKR